VRPTKAKPARLRASSRSSATPPALRSTTRSISSRLVRSMPASALPCPPADRSLVAEDRSAGGVRDRTGTGIPPVHARYTRGRQAEECNGHERSPRVRSNRRSARQRSRHQAPFRRRARVRVSPPPPQGPGHRPGPLLCPRAATEPSVHAGCTPAFACSRSRRSARWSSSSGKRWP
jgi:hypothetical protein